MIGVHPVLPELALGPRQVGELQGHLKPPSGPRLHVLLVVAVEQDAKLLPGAAGHAAQGVASLLELGKDVEAVAHARQHLDHVEDLLLHGDVSIGLGISIRVLGDAARERGDRTGEIQVRVWMERYGRLPTPESRVDSCRGQLPRAISAAQLPK